MADLVHVGLFDYPRKTTVADMNGIAVFVPEMKSMTTDQQVNDAGIPQPDAAPGGSNGAGVLTGDYIYKITYYDEDRDEEGQGSATLTRSSLSSNKVTLDISALTNRTSNTRVTHWRVYRSLAGGQVLFRVATVAIGTDTYEDNNTDATISALDTLRINEQAFKAPVANTYGFIVKHGTRLFMFGPADYYDYDSSVVNWAAWTNSGSADQWPDENTNEIGNKDPIRSATPMGDALIVFKEDEICMWLYQNNPDGQVGDGRIEPMGVGRGAVTFKSVVNVDGMIYALDRRGIYEYRGGQSVLDMTEPIRGIFDRINWDQQAQFCGTYDDKHIMWFVALDDDTNMRHALVLDRQALQNGRGVFWWLYELPQYVRDCTSFIQGRSTLAKAFHQAGRRFAGVITLEGYSYVFANVYSDGVHPDMDAEGVTAGASDQAFTVTGADYDIGNADLAGCYVKFDHTDTPEPLLIASSSTNTFTLDSALSRNLPAGTSFKIGRIKAYWKSSQLDGGDNTSVKDFQYAHITHEPTGDNGTFEVRFSGDRLAPNLSQLDEDQTGWSASENGDSVSVDTGGNLGDEGRDGIVRIPIHSRDSRYIQVQFESENYTPWKVVGYKITGNSKKSNN